ncbi:MAG: Wzz/FepE/Etk N-terminal domain-containing protein, partial [Litorilituus sp.]|nr:Wzz/FepE/Etk N-terminal domain-containing protein [Litorilituus sp.]
MLQQQMLLAQMQQSQQQDDEIDLAELWRAIWGGKLTIIAISFLFAVSSIFFALSKPNVYKASALLAPASAEAGAGGL